jgi:hypothetical protein
VGRLTGETDCTAERGASHRPAWSPWPESHMATARSLGLETSPFCPSQSEHAYDARSTLD